MKPSAKLRQAIRRLGATFTEADDGFTIDAPTGRVWSASFTQGLFVSCQGRDERADAEADAMERMKMGTEIPI